MPEERTFEEGFDEGTITSRLGRIEIDVEKATTSMNFLSKIGIGILVSVGIWVGTIQTRQLRNIDDISTVTTRVDTVAQRQQNSDVTSAEIRTKLINIEATLIEIKQNQVKQLR